MGAVLLASSGRQPLVISKEALQRAKFGPYTARNRAWGLRAV
jgi:hypothetical protein